MVQKYLDKSCKLSYSIKNDKCLIIFDALTQFYVVKSIMNHSNSVYAYNYANKVHSRLMGTFFKSYSIFYAKTD